MLGHLGALSWHIVPGEGFSVKRKVFSHMRLPGLWCQPRERRDRIAGPRWWRHLHTPDARTGRMRAVIYRRVSTTEQAENHGLRLQT
jgi:hypothetical protein